MTGRTLRIGIASATASVARSIAETARLGPLVVLTHRSLRDLIAELGSMEAAIHHLNRVAEDAGRPIGVNFETGAGASRSVFLAPRSWTSERLRGWIAGHHDVLEGMFGAATVVPLRDL